MRITLSHLQAVCDRINHAHGTPLTPYSKRDDGTLVANIGNFHLSGAYGGYALHQMANDGGGVRDLFGGHMPKRELAARMHAYLRGMDDGQAMASRSATVAPVAGPLAPSDPSRADIYPED